MAKIRTQSVKCFTSFIHYEIHYEARRSRFIAKLPANITEYAHATGLVDPVCKGATETELIQAVKELIASYEKQEVKERAVILYRVHWASPNVEEHPRPRYDHYNKKEGVRLDLVFQVCIERSVDDLAQYFKKVEVDRFHSTGLEKLNDPFNGEKFETIDWTAEREAFFKEFHAGVETLIRRLESFVGTPEKMTRVADKGTKLLEFKC